MALDTDDLAKIQKAILNRDSFEDAGLKDTPEMREAFETIREQISHAPEGIMIEIVEDIAWGKWDALIESSQKASGIDYMSL
jgi:hypothetical protein